MKKIISILACAGFLFGCDRLKKDEATKIQIQLPVLTAATVPNSSSAEPTGFAGTRPFNCYMVAVSGPEEILHRNTCQRKDGTAIFTPRQVGMWSGAAPAGGAISIDVPSGLDRSVFVFGFYAADLVNCRDFKVNGFPNGTLSSPYIVGELAHQEFKSGETVDLPVPLSYDVNKRFDNCTGPDFPEGTSGPGSVTPTKVTISRDRFPYLNTIQNQCESFDLRLVDDAGREGSMSTPLGIQMKINGTPISTFATFADCTNSTPTMPAVNIPAGDRQAQVIFRVPSSGSDTTFTLEASAAPFTASSTQLIGSYMSASTKGVELIGPMWALPDMCYPYTIAFKTFAGSPASVTSSNVIYNDAGGFKLYADAACSAGNVKPTGSITVTGGAPVSIYGKFTGTANAPLAMHLADATFATSDITIRAGSGSANIGYLEIRGDNMVSGVGTCYSRPYQVTLVNENHTPIIAPASYPFTFDNAGTDFQFTNNSGCTPPLAGGTLAAGQHAMTVYIRPITTGLHPMSVTGAGLLGPSIYMINVGP